jgi:hypothetical protein
MNTSARDHSALLFSRRRPFVRGGTLRFSTGRGEEFQRDQSPQTSIIGPTQSEWRSMRLIAFAGLVILAVACGDSKTRGAALSGVSPWTYTDGLTGC